MSESNFCLPESSANTPSPTSSAKTVVDEAYAIEIISKFLNQDWAKAKLIDVTLTSIQGGYLNSLWIVENKALPKGSTEPRKVVLRHYGGNMFDAEMKMMKEQDKSKNFIKNSETEEVLIFYEQSRTRNGPKLIGVFPGGRIEEYVEGHTLTAEEASDPEFIPLLAHAFARYSCNDFPFPKNKIAKLAEAILNPQEEPPQLTPEQQVRLGKMFASVGVDPRTCVKVDIKAELAWLFSSISIIDLKYGFINYDTNYLNCLVRENPEVEDQKVLLIDYEMAFWAPRGIDIGSHWINRSISWNGKQDKRNGHAFPPEEDRKLFIREYLKELERINPGKFNTDGKDTEEHLMMEADFGVLFFSLFFSTILLKHGINFEKEPSFLTVIPVMQDIYVQHKLHCQQRYPEWPRVIHSS